MKPRLVFISGPLKDAVYPLAETEVSLGRAATNEVVLSDPRVSRRHCRIEYAAGKYQLCDLDSTSGTFANCTRVRAHTLTHGDQLDLGGTRAVFLLYDDDPRRFAQPVTLDEHDLVAHTTIRLAPEDALYISPERARVSLPPLAQMARDFAVLLNLSTNINAVRDPEVLQRHLLEAVCEVIPAERGAILLAGPSPDEFASVYGWTRAPTAPATVPVSRTLARQVLQSKLSLLSNDVAERAEFTGVQSLEATPVRSLLCVPLLLHGRALGVIYLTTDNALQYFNEDHLHLLTVISGIAAVALENARHMTRLSGENEQLRADSVLEHEFIGLSPRFRAVVQLIGRLAQTDATVLICGESGTGKELAARALHRNSPRAGQAFVVINCAALTEPLLESELFGHERGAFAGAAAPRVGKLEVAAGGTLFLDEVGDLTPPLQAKLLRVLQERAFERVGSTATRTVDVRLIAATNRDLPQAIAAGQFRADLYYRLNVVAIEMPALREHPEDIPTLAAHFTQKYARRFKRRVTGVSRAAEGWLVGYDWPGNVRELENAIERAVVLGAADVILPEDLPETVLDAAPAAASAPVTPYHEAVRAAKQQVVARALERAAGSYTEAARLLGVQPDYLQRLLRNLKLKPEQPN